MSRSGYSEDIDNWDLIRWRGAVASAIRGKRGQDFLRELLASLDAMPVKELIKGELQDEKGSVCALGVIGVARGLPVDTLDPEEHEHMGKVFGIAQALICEIEFENDEAAWKDDPELRWTMVRGWVARQIKEES